MPKKYIYEFNGWCMPEIPQMPHHFLQELHPTQSSPVFYSAPTPSSPMSPPPHHPIHLLLHPHPVTQFMKLDDPPPTGIPPTHHHSLSLRVFPHPLHFSYIPTMYTCHTSQEGSVYNVHVQVPVYVRKMLTFNFQFFFIKFINNISKK